MRIEQGGNTRRAISLNDQFFQGLTSLIEEVREAALKAVAEEYEVSLEDARSVSETPVAERPRPGKLGEQGSLADLDREFEIREQENRNRAIRRGLDQYTMMSLNLNFSNGYSFKPNDLDELKSILSREPGRAESLYLRIGWGLRTLGFNLHLTNNIVRTASFEVTGERKEAEHLYRRIIDLLRSVEPEHQWLHSAWFSSAFTTIISLAVTFSSIILYMKIADSSNFPIYMGIMAVFLGSLASFLVGRQLSYAFPKCQFEYGPEWRHRKARRTFIFVLMTVFIVPLIISAII